MRRVLSEFAGDRRGAIAIIFAFALPVIIGAAALAVDYGAALGKRSTLQSALDSAVLSAANPSVADEDREELFLTTFAANLPKGMSVPNTPAFKYNDGKGVAKLDYTHANGLASALGIPSFKMALRSEASTAKLDLEIVFVLDISGSMLGSDMGGGTRLEALKTASKGLMDTIMAARRPGQTVKFAVVPFNMAVNIGPANSSYVVGADNPLFAGTTWGGCVLERRGGYHHQDVYRRGASDGAGEWQAYVWPPSPNTPSGACLNQSNGTNAGYGSVEPAPLGRDPWRDGPNFNCPRFPIVPLTDNEGAVTSAIDALEAYGNMGTVVGPAVAWALRVLSPEEPFTGGSGFNRGTRKIMIVVTDGDMVTDGGTQCFSATNSTTAYRFDPATLGLPGRVLTRGPSNDSFTPYGFLLDSDPFNQGLSTARQADQELDRLSIEACEEAKRRGGSAGAVQIFTIAASTGAGPGSRAQSVLSRCASSPSHFLYAADADALDSAFKKIADQAMNLRLTH